MNEIAIILIIVIIIIILCIIILTLRHKRLNKPQSKNFAELVENLPPYGVDQNVQEAKEAFAYIENPTPLEHYRMAMIYLHNFEQKENARQEFVNALQGMGQDVVNDDDLTNEEAIFILDGILTHNQLLNAPIPIEDIKIAEVPRERTNLWVNDTQNVHDSLVMQQMRQQLEIVKKENKDLPEANYYDIKAWCRENTKDAVRCEMVFAVLDQNYHLSHLGEHEQTYITQLWTRFTDPRNAEKYNLLREAFLTCIDSCVENERVVCGIGRPVKIWSSLATLDFNKEMGIFHTKQVYHHGYYSDAADLRKTLFFEADEETLKDYNSDNHSEKYVQFEAKYKAMLQKLRKKYDMLSPVILDKLENDSLKGVFV